jgi:uncharacterized protein YgiM (DUF1202 family)
LSKYDIKYAKAALNVREKPNSVSKVVKTLQPNEGVRTNGKEENGFAQILISEQKFGWCASKYLQDKPLAKEELEKAQEEHQQNKSDYLDYSIIAKEDISSADVKKMIYRIRFNVGTLPSETKIKSTCNKIWRNGNTHWGSFNISVYLPDMETVYCLLEYSNKGFENITHVSDRKVGAKMEKWKNLSNGNRYVVKDDEILAATSKANFNLMMNCVIDKDAQALQTMFLQGQLIILHKNDVVYLVKPTFNYYIVRLEGSTELLYVIDEQIKKQ